MASLSLGSIAEMHFRLRSTHIVDDGPRKVAMSLLLRHVGGTGHSSESHNLPWPCRAMFSSWKEPACKSITSEPSSLLCDTKLDTVLRHFVVDRHAVFPQNFRIVATARSISPENYAT